MKLGTVVALCACFWSVPCARGADRTETLTMGNLQATISIAGESDLRTYSLTTNAELRDHQPPDKKITFTETNSHARTRTGSLFFDGLYAMAVSEARANSVSVIRNDAFAHNAPLQIETFQTGEFWTYVWTRDLSYSVHLALAGFDPQRAANSLLFKSSILKPSVKGQLRHQVVQDTGSGGSYPVSTDRVVWALGVNETLHYMSSPGREEFLARAYPILCDTIEQDRRLIFDPADGLYRGEQSFLDWREQTYPGWTQTNVLAIAMSKALSTNALHYFLLKTAADYSALLKDKGAQSRYTKWAGDLKESINREFYDEKAGLYRSYLLSDELNHNIPVSRYDLLGESLAILFDLADGKKAERIIASYPTGPFGPPVVWPQEKAVPIYHNQAIWPFVTAYWLKAARKAQNAAAANAGIESLQRLAALNLSNMENYDFITGRSCVTEGARKGPVVDSRRQLWSVAGYLAMVQDVVFGMETSWEGVRFHPFVTAKLRSETFGSADRIELNNLEYRGTRITVRLHLPKVNPTMDGMCEIDRIELNGVRIGDEFVRPEMLQPTNSWEVFLKPSIETKKLAELRKVDVTNERVLFSPSAPRWTNGSSGKVDVENGKNVLSYEHDDLGNVVFNIHRDGSLLDRGIKETKWIDNESDGRSIVLHSYSVEAMDVLTGNVSHQTPVSLATGDNEKLVIPASAMANLGGNLAESHHFENWGKPDHELLAKNIRVKASGCYQIRAEFSNGAGPLNTGITCGVKRLDLRDMASRGLIASGYLVMPQSGDWKRFDLSSWIMASLQSGRDYQIRISEDEYCRNMSYLQSNERYTAASGGGVESYNFVNIASLQLMLARPLENGAATRPVGAP